MTVHTPRTPWLRVALTALGAALLVGVILLGFAWPSVTSESKDLAVGVVGTAEQIESIRTAIDEKADGAVILSEYDDRADAVAAIETREVYGAIVLGATPTDAPEVLTASAAGTAPTQLLQGLATTMQGQIDAQVRSAAEAGVQQAAAAGAAAALSAFTIPTVEVVVTDVVPLADSDPRGTGFTAAMFPLTLGGMLGAVIISFTVTGTARRLTGLVAYAAGAGLVLAGILQGGFGALQGDYLLNAAAVALTIAAVSGPIVGLFSLIGAPGLGIGALFTLLLANPLSAATMPHEFLVSPWGDLGQALAPGAAATLLRDLSYFPDASTTSLWLTLGAWALGGISLIALSALRRPATATASALPRSGAIPVVAAS